MKLIATIFVCLSPYKETSFLLLLTEIFGVALVKSMIQVSGVRFYNASSVYGAVCSAT